MLRRIGAVAAVGVLTLAVGTPLARGQDTYRLGGTVGEGKTTTLSWDGQAETELTRGYRGGVGYRGHYHVGHYHYAHYHVGHYGYGHYRPYYASFYAGGYYRPYYYAPYVYTTPAYYYSAPAVYYYSPPCYTYPISVNVGNGGQVYKPVYGGQEPPYQGNYQGNLPPMKPAPGGDGTYPYDGGPVVPVPLPKDSNSNPNVQPGIKVAPVPSDGRLVSIPGAQPKTQTGSTGFAYPAYGQQQSSNFASDRLPTGVDTAKNKKQ